MIKINLILESLSNARTNGRRQRLSFKENRKTRDLVLEEVKSGQSLARLSIKMSLNPKK
jgi:hypothetical protein